MGAERNKGLENLIDPNRKLDKLEDTSIKDRSTVLSSVDSTLTLEELLKGVTKESCKLLQEDRDWIDALPIGKEVFE